MTATDTRTDEQFAYAIWQRVQSLRDQLRIILQDIDARQINALGDEWQPLVSCTATLRIGAHQALLRAVDSLHGVVKRHQDRLRTEKDEVADRIVDQIARVERNLSGIIDDMLASRETIVIQREGTKP